MNQFVRSIDAVSEFSGRLSAWMFFTIGLFITYEVVMRYVFTAPTVWVDEVSRIMQVWAAANSVAPTRGYRADFDFFALPLDFESQCVCC